MISDNISFVLCIYSSAMFASTAAVLDIVLLHRRNINPQDPPLLKTIVIARGALISAYVGLHLLFYWRFVAIRQRCERKEISAADDTAPNSLMNLAVGFHSASWSRLGNFGLFLKYASLVTVIAVVASELAWRIFNFDQRIVFIVDDVCEISLLALFVLKLFLNAYWTPMAPTSRALVPYLAPITALVVDIATSIGGLVLCEYLFTTQDIPCLIYYPRVDFSDTALGQSLQAFSFYVIMFYILFFSLCPPDMNRGFPRKTTAKPQSYLGSKDLKPATSFGSLQIQSPHSIPPTIERSRRSEDVPSLIRRYPEQRTSRASSPLPASFSIGVNRNNDEVRLRDTNVMERSSMVIPSPVTRFQPPTRSLVRPQTGKVSVATQKGIAVPHEFLNLPAVA